MRTIRATLSGGPHCGLNLHPSREVQLVVIDGFRYLRTELRDSENRQIFAAVHRRTLASLRGFHGVR